MLHFPFQFLSFPLTDTFIRKSFWHWRQLTNVRILWSRKFISFLFVLFENKPSNDFRLLEKNFDRIKVSWMKMFRKIVGLKTNSNQDDIDLIWIIKIQRRTNKTVVNSFKRWWWWWWVTFAFDPFYDWKPGNTFYVCVCLFVAFSTSVSIICKWAKDILGLNIFECYTFLYFCFVASRSVDNNWTFE